MTKIALPTWYACFDVAASSRPVGAAVAPDVIEHGPITLYNLEISCQTLPFGESGENFAIFDGYLLDKAELTTVLAEPGAALSEVELVIRAYRRWGTEMFNQLDGGYTAAIWDARERCFIVGRDAMGIHPLYYAHQSGKFWFAPNILALARSGQIPRDPNRLSLALRLLRRWPLAGQTFFEHINRLRSGHYYRHTPSGGWQEQPYWLPLLSDDEPYLPDEQVIEDFESQFRKTVNRYMELDVQGIMFSGGLDSVSVAMMASQYLQERGAAPLLAYSARNPPEYPRSYEEDAQDRVAAYLGMPQRISHAGMWHQGRGPLAATFEEIRELSEPTDIWWSGDYIGFYRHTAREGCQVLLTGSGGDEWLGTTDEVIADALRQFAIQDLLLFLHSQQVSFDSTAKDCLKMVWYYGFRTILRGYAVKYLLPEKWLRNRRQRRLTQRWPGWFCADPQLLARVEEALLEDFALPDLTAEGRIPRSYYRHRHNLGLRNSRMTYEFETSYFVERKAGLKLLKPFHDRALVELLYRASPRVLTAGAQYKGLIRPLARKYLPGLGLERQKKLYPQTADSYNYHILSRELKTACKHIGWQALEKMGLVIGDQLDYESLGDSGVRLKRHAQIFRVLSAETWINTIL